MEENTTSIDDEMFDSIMKIHEMSMSDNPMEASLGRCQKKLLPKVGEFLEEETKRSGLATAASAYLNFLAHQTIQASVATYQSAKEDPISKGMAKAHLISILDATKAHLVKALEESA